MIAEKATSQILSSSLIGFWIWYLNRYGCLGNYSTSRISLPGVCARLVLKLSYGRLDWFKDLVRNAPAGLGTLIRLLLSPHYGQEIGTLQEKFQGPGSEFWKASQNRVRIGFRRREVAVIIRGALIGSSAHGLWLLDGAPPQGSQASLTTALLALRKDLVVKLCLELK